MKRVAQQRHCCGTGQEANMEKLIYLLQRNPEDTRPEFIRRLQKAGREMLRFQPLGLRLNVQDEAVEQPDGTWPTSSYGPFEAVLQIWLEHAEDDALRLPYEELLAGLGSAFHGYLVDERLLVMNLGNQPTAEFRSEGYSQFAILQIPERLDRASWLKCWQGRHTWVAISIHPHLEYNQNPVIRAVTADAPPIHGFGEEVFPAAGLNDESFLYKAVGEPEKFKARRHIMFEDAERFIDFDHLDMIITSQFDLRPPPR